MKTKQQLENDGCLLWFGLIVIALSAATLYGAWVWLIFGALLVLVAVL